MHSAVIPFVRFLLRNALQLLLIALILVTGRAALNEWHKLPSARADLATLESSMVRVLRSRDAAIAAARTEVERLRSGSITLLDGRIGALDAAIKASQLADTAPILTLPLSSMYQLPQRLADHFARQVEQEILVQERAYLVQVRYAATNLALFKTGKAKLEALRLNHVALYNAHLKTIGRIATIEDSHQVAVHVLFTQEHDMLQALEATDAALVQKIILANGAYHAQERANQSVKSPTAVGPFALDEKRVEAILVPLHEALAQADATAHGNWVWRLASPVIEILPAALGVLIGGFVSHLLIKAFMFYVLAPRVTRSAPVCILPGLAGTLATHPGPEATSEVTAVRSAVSVPIVLRPTEEMLILHDCVQSSQASGQKQTRWMLDRSCPWTSLVSGMVMLEQIRSSGGETLVVSDSGNNPFSEISCIRIPHGEAMVFQPRGLVGIIQDIATPLRITRHWRLFSLHAWLTLQLRFLVFAGPVTLLVKGNRGVRVESAVGGKMIRQASTLGFSANVRYSTVRCATFFPFYVGRAALLQDRFEADSGYYVYDETPMGSTKAGHAERGLEGLLDATLKVFGI